MRSNTSQSQTEVDAGTRKKLALFAILAGLVVVLYLQFGDALSLQMLARKEAELRVLQDNHPVLVYAAAFLLYVMVTGLSVPGATGLSLVYGWYFGLLRGIVIVSFASTAGATLAFLLSRYLFRDAVQRRFSDRLAGISDALRTEGAFYLFTLRLIPAIPFFVINAVMGLTPMTARTFWWVSQVGMLPGTAVYVYAGSSVPSLGPLAEQGISAVISPARLTQILIAMVLLATFPLIVRWRLNRRVGQRHSSPAADAATTVGVDTSSGRRKDSR